MSPAARKPAAAAAKTGGAPPKGAGGRRAARRRETPLARLRTGEAIYLVAAILLFVLMFLDWYGVSLEKAPGTLQLIGPGWEGGDAWQTLGIIPLFLMLAIVVAVGAALLRLGGSDWKPAIPPGATVCVLGGVAALLILFRIVSPPEVGPEIEGFLYEATVELPAFLALAAALGIAYGGRRAMAEEGTSFSGVAKKLESPRPKPAPKKSASPGRPAREKP